MAAVATKTRNKMCANTQGNHQAATQEIGAVFVTQLHVGYHSAAWDVWRTVQIICGVHIFGLNLADLWLYLRTASQPAKPTKMYSYVGCLLAVPACSAARIADRSVDGRMQIARAQKLRWPDMKINVCQIYPGVALCDTWKIIALFLLNPVQICTQHADKLYAVASSISWLHGNSANNERMSHGQTS